MRVRITPHLIELFPSNQRGYQVGCVYEEDDDYAKWLVEHGCATHDQTGLQAMPDPGGPYPRNSSVLQDKSSAPDGNAEAPPPVEAPASDDNEDHPEPVEEHHEEEHTEEEADEGGE